MATPSRAWLVPRYQPQNFAETQEQRAVVPVSLRALPRRYCFQCGGAIPPWRDMCASHDRRQGRRLPAIPRLMRVA